MFHFLAEHGVLFRFHPHILYKKHPLFNNKITIFFDILFIAFLVFILLYILICFSSSSIYSITKTLFKTHKIDLNRAINIRTEFYNKMTGKEDNDILQYLEIIGNGVNEDKTFSANSLNQKIFMSFSIKLKDENKDAIRKLENRLIQTQLFFKFKFYSYNLQQRKKELIEIQKEISLLDLFEDYFDYNYSFLPIFIKENSKIKLFHPNPFSEIENSKDNLVNLSSVSTIRHRDSKTRKIVISLSNEIALIQILHLHFFYDIFPFLISLIYIVKNILNAIFYAIQVSYYTSNFIKTYEVKYISNQPKVLAFKKSIQRYNIGSSISNTNLAVNNSNESITGMVSNNNSLSNFSFSGKINNKEIPSNNNIVTKHKTSTENSNLNFSFQNKSSTPISVNINVLSNSKAKIYNNLINNSFRDYIKNFCCCIKIKINLEKINKTLKIKEIINKYSSIDEIVVKISLFDQFMEKMKKEIEELNSMYIINTNNGNMIINNHTLNKESIKH